MIKNERRKGDQIMFLNSEPSVQNLESPSSPNSSFSPSHLSTPVSVSPATVSFSPGRIPIDA